MGNLLSRIYDFFAFALPGACLIIAVLLFPSDQKNLILDHLPWDEFGISYKLIILGFAGYLAGYIITPLTRLLLLRGFAVKLSCCLELGAIHFYKRSKNKNFKENRKIKIKKQYSRLIIYLSRRNHSKTFVKIRQDAKESAQYIEFWDMHVSMSVNLAFASLILLILQVINWCSYEVPVFTFCPASLVLTGIISFFLLLANAIKYSFWWMFDIEAASKKYI